MFSNLKGRLGVVGLLAVVLATAVAVVSVPAVAEPVANASQSLAKQVKRALGLSKKANKKATRALKLAKRGGQAGAQGPAGPAGQAGAIGPVGPQGPAGAPGARGADGINGTNGTNGEDGDPGQPWTPDNELPSNATLTGAWGFGLARTDEFRARVPISFPIRLPNALGAANVRIPTDANFATNCTGTAADPQANPGFLCIYTGHLTGASFSPGDFLPAAVINAAAAAGPAQTLRSAGVSGAVLSFEVSADFAQGSGTWAVTAP
jgi:hypothetical protein